MLILWPAGHRLASHYADINPWKFCGFAMYCTPHIVTVSVGGERLGQYDKIRPYQMSDETKSAYSSLRKNRKTFGRFASPNALGELLLHEHPDMEIIRIEVETKRLNGRTAVLKTMKRTYNYKRDESPEK